jgi:outer membrane protein assembly factor BamB
MTMVSPPRPVHGSGTSGRWMGRFAVVAALTLALAGCQRELILEGERVDLRAPWGETGEIENRAAPLSLPAQAVNAAWSHRQGGSGARPQHPALGDQVQLAWSVPIGAGDSRRARLTTDPVMADGRVYTLDAAAQVQATSAAGAVIWSRDLTPDFGRRARASGGALAVADGRLFVASAFGILYALDAASGQIVWSHRFDGPLTGAPMVQGNRVFVAAADSTLWSFDAATGRVDWSRQGTPSLTVMARGAAPAASGETIVMPTQAGELVALRRSNGAVLWNTQVVGRRVGAAYAQISAITGDPVIDGSRVYAANQSGRLVAMDLRNGQTLWSAREAAYSPVWPVGGSVFLVSDENRLMRLDARTGEAIWAQELPLYRAVRWARNRGPIEPQHGPVLAGGRLWVASGDGVLRGFDPVSGATVAQIDIPGGAASGPIVADRTLYVLGRGGVLHAFR